MMSGWIDGGRCSKRSLRWKSKRPPSKEAENFRTVERRSAQRAAFLLGGAYACLTADWFTRRSKVSSSGCMYTLIKSSAFDFGGRSSMWIVALSARHFGDHCFQIGSHNFHD